MITERQIEEILTIGIRIGTVATIKRMGLSAEKITLKKAYDLYSRATVDSWRKRGWITFYPTGKSATSGSYCKRSELELASARMDFNNMITVNNLHKEIMK